MFVVSSVGLFYFSFFWGVGVRVRLNIFCYVFYFDD